MPTPTEQHDAVRKAARRDRIRSQPSPGPVPAWVMCGAGAHGRWCRLKPTYRHADFTFYRCTRHYRRLNAAGREQFIRVGRPTRSQP